LPSVLGPENKARQEQGKDYKIHL